MKNFLLGVMITVLCLVATGANYQAAGPKKYEYKVIGFRNNSGRTHSLNEAATGGWKLISTNYLEPFILCFYEREKH